MRTPMRNTKKPTETKTIIHRRNNSSGVRGFLMAAHPGKKESDAGGASGGFFSWDLGGGAEAEAGECFCLNLAKIRRQDGHSKASSRDSVPQFGHFMV